MVIMGRWLGAILGFVRVERMGAVGRMSYRRKEAAGGAGTVDKGQGASIMTPSLGRASSEANRKGRAT